MEKTEVGTPCNATISFDLDNSEKIVFCDRDILYQ